MAKNPAGKSRNLRSGDKPYLTIQGHGVLAGWTWKVLKFWQADGGKLYARAFCDVSSPHTFGGSDLGDVYVQDLRDALRLGGAVTQIDGITKYQACALLGMSSAAVRFYGV